MKKKKHTDAVISNRRASFDYDLKDTYRAGIVLSGAETRSVRSHHASLQGAFVQIKDEEAWLVNAQIMPVKTNAAQLPSDKQIQNRKLLLKRKEISQLIAAKQQGYTIVPLRILTKTRFIKIEVAIGKGKRKFDKRQVIKQRDQSRDVARTLHI